MATARESRFKVGRAELYCRDIGRGVPVLVLHGGPDFDHQYFLPELDRLADSCRLIYYAQRGRGASRGGVRPEDVALASDLADLDALRAHLNLESIALLGHSWGGLLAMEYAIRHPERVSRLVLMNTGPASQDDYAHFRAERLRNTPSDMARLVELASTPAYQAGELAADAAYYRVHFGATIRDPKQLEQLVHRLRANFTPEGILVARAIEDRLMSETWSAAGYDLFPSLRGLRVPTLVIHGEHDFVPVDLVRRIAEAIPGARFELIAGSGHFSYLDAPETVQRTVAGFLS